MQLLNVCSVHSDSFSSILLVKRYRRRSLLSTGQRYMMDFAHGMQVSTQLSFSSINLSLTRKSVTFNIIQGRITFHSPDAVELDAGITLSHQRRPTAASRHRLVLAAGRQRSPPLETATPDADSFLDDGRMAVESSGKIMLQPCFWVYGA